MTTANANRQNGDGMANGKRRRLPATTQGMANTGRRRLTAVARCVVCLCCCLAGVVVVVVVDGVGFFYLPRCIFIFFAVCFLSFHFSFFTFLFFFFAHFSTLDSMSFLRYFLCRLPFGRPYVRFGVWCLSVCVCVFGGCACMCVYQLILM